MKDIANSDIISVCEISQTILALEQIVCFHLLIIDLCCGNDKMAMMKDVNGRQFQDALLPRTRPLLMRQ